MTKSIALVSDIRIGFPGQPEEQGDIAFLQLRQFNEDGVVTNYDSDMIKLTEKVKPHLLKDGDVLFVGKGSRLFAWCYKKSHVGAAVASSSFFVLRTDTRQIHPGYLAAFLNAPQTRAALTQLGGGTNIFSIRKLELGAFQVPVLPMEKQARVAELAMLYQQEIQLAKEIISLKQNLYTAVISKLIK